MRPGDTINDRYEVLRLSRTGSTGMVFQAVDRRTAKNVAVKLITADRGAPGLAARIDREIEILSTLSHPNVVDCYGSGKLDNGQLYLILEWLHGEDLADFKVHTSMSLRDALDVARQVADGLAAAHAHDIVHRDIKPANIFLVRPRPDVMPDVRVLDFGVAKQNDDQQALTFAGAILGTPCYMAPEQANFAMNVDAKADVFSLGVVLFELITGRLPWASASDLARLARILIEPAKRIREVAPEIPAPVAAAVDAMLEHRPADRPASMGAVHALMMECLSTVTPSDLSYVYSEIGGVQHIVREPTAAADPRKLPGSGRGRRPRTRNQTERLEATQIAFPPARKRRKPSTLPIEITEDRNPIPEQATEFGGLHERLIDFGVRKGTPATPVSSPAQSFQSGVRFVPLEATNPIAFNVPDSVPNRAKHDDGLSYVASYSRVPMLGRQKLVDHLMNGIRETLNGERPARTVVVGPAGIGKTRIRAELTRRIRELGHNPVVLAGRADERARSSPFSFLRRMLLAQAHVYADDPIEVQEGKLATLLPEAMGERKRGSEDRTRFTQPGQWTERPSVVAAMSDAFQMVEHGPAGSDDEQAALLTYLADVLQVHVPQGAPVWAARRDPRLMSVETRRVLDIVLAHLAQPSGMVLLLDDAHFLDHLSAQVLAELTRRGRSHRVTLICFAQPTLLEGDSEGVSPLAGEGSAIVEVGPLPPDVSRDLVQRIVSDVVRSDATEVLIQRASGNPLYLEQLVRAVQETGVLARIEGEYHLTGLTGEPTDADRVPPTVAGAVRARLSCLPSELKETLAAAAVFGDVFWVEGVAMITGADLDTTTERLDKLLLLELVRRRPRSRYQGATEIEFTHSVIRSVVLSRKKRERRKSMERMALAFLESVAETDEVTLAQHTASVGYVEDAALLFAKAAGRALASGAFSAAAALADEGQRLVDGESVSENTRAGLLDLISRTAELREHYEQADDALAQLLALRIPEESRAEMIERRAGLAMKRHRLDDAAELAELAHRMWRNLNLPLGEASARLTHAEALLELDDGRGALRGFLQAKPILDKHDSRLGLARCAHGLAQIARSSGDYSNAERRYREALIQARAGHDAIGVFDTLLGLADVARVVGDSDRAREFLEGAKRLVVLPEQHFAVRLQRALMVAEGGNVPKASRILREVATRARPPNGPAALWRRAALHSAQIIVGFGPDASPERNIVRGLVRDVERALVRAPDEAPRLVLALEGALCYLLALDGNLDRASAYAERVMDRFTLEGTVHEDESPRLLFAHAKTLQRIGASTDDVAAGLARAVEQLDVISSRLERAMRQRYLARSMSRTIIVAAEQAGLHIVRDPSSYRLTVDDR